MGHQGSWCIICALLCLLSSVWVNWTWASVSLTSKPGASVSSMKLMSSPCCISWQTLMEVLVWTEFRLEDPIHAVVWQPLYSSGIHLSTYLSISSQACYLWQAVKYCQAQRCSGFMMSSGNVSQFGTINSSGAVMISPLMDFDAESPTLLQVSPLRPWHEHKLRYKTLRESSLELASLQRNTHIYIALHKRKKL